MARLILKRVSPDCPLLFAFLVLLFLLPCCPDTLTAQTGDRILTIGKVSGSLFKVKRDLLPLSRYLSEHMGGHGIGEVAVKHAGSVEEMIGLLSRGEVDVIWETPYGASRFMKSGLAEARLMASRNGIDFYRSYVFVHKDSGIKSIDDLKGRVIAFQDLGSTTAFFLPRASMVCAGLEFEALQSDDALVSGNRVGYVFVQEERNISTNVFLRKVDAGAFSNLNWLDDKDNPPNFRRAMRVIHQTNEVPRMVVLFRSTLEKLIKEQVISILLAMHDNEAGRETLKRGKMQIDRFNKMPEVISHSLSIMFDCEQDGNESR